VSPELVVVRIIVGIIIKAVESGDELTLADVRGAIGDNHQGSADDLLEDLPHLLYDESRRVYLAAILGHVAGAYKATNDDGHRSRLSILRAAIHVALGESRLARKWLDRASSHTRSWAEEYEFQYITQTVHGSGMGYMGVRNMDEGARRRRIRYLKNYVDDFNSIYWELEEYA
jgi:hypothetical protein